MKIIIKCCILMMLMSSCASSEKSNEPPSEALKTLVSEKSFTISSNWADPQFGRAFTQLGALGFTPGNTIGTRIDVSGLVNYLTFKNDSVFGHFPYFGERHLGSSYSNIDQGIQFKGNPKDLIITETGSTLKMTFKIADAKAKNEKYEVEVKLNSKFNTLIEISSTHRNSITYEGSVLNND